MSELRWSPRVPDGSSVDLEPPLTLTLPFGPSTNKLYAAVFGRRVLSAEGKKYKRFVGARVPAYRGLLEDNQWLTMDMVFYAPLYNGKKAKRPKKQWDVTNRVKVLEDAICDALGLDDRCVKSVLLVKEDAPKAESRVEVTVGLERE